MGVVPGCGWHVLLERIAKGSYIAPTYLRIGSDFILPHGMSGGALIVAMGAVGKTGKIWFISALKQCRVKMVCFK